MCLQPLAGHKRPSPDESKTSAPSPYVGPRRIIGGIGGHLNIIMATLA